MVVIKVFPTGPFAHFGPLRLTEDVLALPGHLCAAAVADAPDPGDASASVSRCG